MRKKSKKRKTGEKLSRYSPEVRRGPRYRYPWDDWLDGKSKWKITRGEEFSSEVASMLVTIRRRSYQRGILVSLYREGDSIVIVNRGKR